MNKAVFIDKDGTLIPDIPYNVNPKHITLSEGAAEGLKRLREAGYLLVIISNQSGVAHGYFREEELNFVSTKIASLLANEGVRLDGIYYCPHHPEGSIEDYTMECSCRKPSPGLLLKAASDLSINLPASWMIGDILNDMEAGKRAGCKTILIDNGNETEWLLDEYRTPDWKAANILEATNHIIKEVEVS